MYKIVCPYVAILIIAIISYKVTKEICKNKAEDLLYNHAKKSMIELYRFLYLFGVGFIIVDMLYKYMSFIGNPNLIQNSSISDTYAEICILRVMKMLCIITYIIIASTMLYPISEVKHISLSDSIGAKNKGDLEAIKFFKKTALMGFFMILIMEYLIYLNGIVLFIVLNLIFIVIFLLGMADLLQHSGYYKWDFEEKRKTFSFLEKCYIYDIYKGLSSKQSMEKSYKTLKENIRNIKIGIKMALVGHA